MRRMNEKKNRWYNSESDVVHTSVDGMDANKCKRAQERQKYSMLIAKAIDRNEEKVKERKLNTKNKK